MNPTRFAHTSFPLMKSHLLFTAACFLTTAALAQEFTLAEFARRPEFWPAQCTVKRAFKFQRGAVAAGQKVALAEVRGDKLVLATDDGLMFQAAPGETDAFALSSAIWKMLSPKQRELTYAALLQRPDLWPYRVALTQEVDLGNMKIARGEAVILKAVEGDQLLVASERANTMFDVKPRDTNVIVGAWKILGSNQPGTGRYTEELKGKLVSATTGSSVTLTGDEPRYYAFYRGASWCGPCRQFSPSLVKFYNRVKPAHPEFELILISNDEKAADMYKYAKEENFTWPAVPMSQYNKLHIINPLFGNSIPQLVITDRHGKVLIDSDRVGREPALKQLEALLNKPTDKLAAQ